jgi:hypothetical protein
LAWDKIVPKQDIASWDESSEKSCGLGQFLALVVTAGLIAGLVLIAITLGPKIRVT